MTEAQRLRRIANIIETVDNRCMWADGPVTPTLKEMTQEEISEIYALSKGEPKDEPSLRFDSPIHGWFGLTYSSYLVLHRSLMQKMPRQWQLLMVSLLDEMRSEFDYEQIPDSFMVRAKNTNGRFIADPFANYRHPPEIPRRGGDTEADFKPVARP